MILMKSEKKKCRILQVITTCHKTNHTVGYNLRLTTRRFSLFPARKLDMRQGENFMSYDHCMLTVTRRSFCVILGNELGLHKYLLLH